MNISLVDLLTDMPNCAKFLKKIISNKKKLQEGVIEVSESCSCIIKNDTFIPKKLKDPGTCTIPCDIGMRHFAQTLYDLGCFYYAHFIGVFYWHFRKDEIGTSHSSIS